MIRTFTCCLAALLVFQFSALSQEKEELDAVTITASLHPQKISETGRNLLVIKGEQFYGLPIHSIDELLRFVPGIEIQSRGPLGAQADIVMRGGTFQQVLVILDGARLNDANTGHFSAYIPISPFEIERIEILKGASSAIYGSEAVGGVIHIITKTFASRMGAGKKQASAMLTAGEFGLFTAHAGGLYSNGKTSVSAAYSSNNLSGQQQRGIHGSIYANTASASFSHFINKNWQLNLRYAYDNRNFSAQNFYTGFLSDTAQEKVDMHWGQLGISYAGQKHQVKLNMAYKDLDDQYRYNPSSSANQSKSQLLQLLMTDEWQLDQSTTITSGAQWLRKSISSNDRGDHSGNTLAAFALLNKKIFNNFIVNPAMRLEWNEMAGFEFVPQLNLSYRKEKLQLRASVGKTIRDADYTERYNNYNKSFVTGGRIGNPDLVAETSISYEAGGDYFFSRELKLSAGFFQRHHKKLIDYVTTPYSEMPRKDNLSPFGMYALAKNISKVITSGLETDLQFSKSFNPKKELSLNAGLVWINTSSSDSVITLYISSHAKLLGNFTAQYRLGKVKISASGLYKQRKKQEATAGITKVSPEYFTMNFRTEYFLIQNKLSAFIEGDNIFDSNYADLLGATMPRRSFMGGIKFNFSK